MSIIKNIFSGSKRADTSGLTSAARETNALQERMYDETIAREQPFYETGRAGNEELARRLGLSGDAESEGYGGLTQSFDMEQYQSDPGYQFRLDEGNQALERKLAASGKTFSPEAAKALMGYGQGMASQEYGQAYDRYNIDQGNLYNRLAGISGTGQQAGSAMTRAGTGYASNVGQTNASLASAQVAAAEGAKARDQSMFGTLFGGATSLGGAYLGRK